MSPVAAAPAVRTTETAPAPAIRTAELLQFYVPLAATTMFYAVIFNVMNSVMSRTVEAATALAAFAMGQSIADIIAVPAGSGNQWLVARARDRRSFALGLRVMVQLVGAVFVVLLLAGWTPLGRFVFVRVFGAPNHLVPSIGAALKVCLPLPAIFMLRGASQSVLMVRRQTHLMTAGVVVRLGYVLGMSFWLRRFPAADGAVLGAFLWISGMGVEGLFDFFAQRRLFREYPAGPANGELPSVGRIWRFLVPLIATSLLWSMGKPILNLGMARTADPEKSIAVYQVTWNAAWLLIAYVQGSFRQVIIVFWRDGRTLEALQRFAGRFALTVTGLLAGLTLTGGTAWFLRSVVGAPSELVEASGGVFLVMSAYPLALMATEVCIGRLLRNGTTGPIGLAKGANLLAMAVVAFGLATWVPQAGAMIGALGALAGVASEFGVAYAATRRLSAAPLPGEA